MSGYVAQEAIRLLGAHHGLSKGAIVTVLGLTFKENVPDLRNSKVIDIVNELSAHGAIVQVHDPYVDADQARDEYGIDLLCEVQLQPAHVVIFAVPHRYYLDSGWDNVARLLDNGKGVVIDVKGRLDRTCVPNDVILWRL